MRAPCLPAVAIVALATNVDLYKAIGGAGALERGCGAGKHRTACPQVVLQPDVTVLIVMF